MRKKAIHQNLNTSFVNVGALVRYLRNLQFVGSVRIELASYEADIIFTSSKTIQAREYDHIAGRIAHGEAALKRILVRAKEPHGRIHVYKAVEGYAGRDDGSVFVDKTIVTQAREMAASAGGTLAQETAFEFVLNGQDSQNALVLAALSEVLVIVDESLAKGKLSFPAAFRIACDAIAGKYPFMENTEHAIAYKNGEIKLNTKADAAMIADAVFEALRPIFRRLRKEIKYGELFRIVSERLREFAIERRDEFVRLGLMSHIEDLLDGEE